jgi:hypothetical protein
MAAAVVTIAAAAAGSFPAYACSGQGIGVAPVVDPASAQMPHSARSETEATASRDSTSPADDETTARSEAERLRVLRDLAKARLRALREKPSGGAGSAIPNVQSTCM